MLAVAIVVNTDQRLQGGADIVEIDFLRVQRTARGLGVVLEFLAAPGSTIKIAHGDCPDAARDTPDHRIFRVHAVGEKERQVGREIVDVHAAREVGLDKGKAVREREGEL